MVISDLFPTIATSLKVPENLLPKFLIECAILKPLPTRRDIINHPSQLWGSSSSSPWVLSLGFNKTTILHQRHLKNSFLVVGSGPHPTKPHLYSKTSSFGTQCGALSLYIWTLSFGAKLVSTFLFFLYSHSRGPSRSKVFLEQFHADCSGCNPLACGYSTGRRKSLPFGWKLVPWPR